ncbi:CbiX/SirB N-terminal domain-containing protein [Ramlibacter sp. AW1]|uniref:CbiX/SirB N-terminal domain-containing protein n=1 Tax=Ramlibacter aurantiacus TaxID=2801330 RepID=A0A936ZQY2_9BURK|nr:CbiX/SirB N-terminal domain-containing protein [Ramlibacter aurantiacus]MBL0422071.1 CbiX/SirB N-terminal domain-containing protein [Ramlibacter aurantiacus]
MEGVILFGHGSRDPQWRRPMDAVASRLAQREPELAVRCAFLELMQPDLPSAAAELARLGLRKVRIVPLFLGVGRHVREDLPRLVELLAAAHPAVAWALQPAVGEEPRLLDLLADLALGNGSA